jgi:hypothetical protein
MRVLGVEIKANALIFVLAENGVPVSTFPNKMELIDSYDSTEVRLLAGALKELLVSANIDAVVIKKRMEKGKFAGGAASFKLEGLVQLSTAVPVTFLSGAQISAVQKKLTDVDWSAVNKYQEQAFIAALSRVK